MNIFNNFALVSAILGWIIAQLIKFVIGLFKEKKLSLKLLYSSGGMPSSHSATVCALATAILLNNGVDSAEFAISFVLAFIVMYDAMGVRRETGEQAKLLNLIMEDFKKGDNVNMPKHFKELIGHTPPQVYAGGILGICISLILRFTGIY